jgi:hypothetical protein
MIGANAMVLLGYVRNTIDLDLIVPEESRSRWLDLLRVDLVWHWSSPGSATAPGDFARREHELLCQGIV